MKKLATTIFAVVLMAAAVSSVTAATVEKTDIELVEGISESYKVEVPASLAAFLVANGVNEDLMDSFDRGSVDASTLSRAIEELKQTEPDDEDDVTLNEQFNAILGSALWSAYDEGYDPVYMDVGSARYVWTTPIDTDDDE